MTKQNKPTQSDYDKLKPFLQTGYRQRISEETGASTSMIDAVLRGRRKDTKGILVAAYKLAVEVSTKLQKNVSELTNLKKSLNL